MPTTRQRSDAQEKRVANLFNGRVNPNSGAVNNIALKGDVRTDTHVIECKCTNKESKSIKLSELNTAKRIARAIGKDYFLDVEFQGDWENDVKGSFCVVDRDSFAEIFENHQSWLTYLKSPDPVALLKNLRSFLSLEARLELAQAIKACPDLTPSDKKNLGVALL